MRLKCIILLSICFVGIKAQNSSMDGGEHLTLNGAIEYALLNNPGIIAVEKEITIARGKILQAGGMQNAEITLEANEIPGSISLHKAGEIDLSFSQQFELFGKRGGRIQSAGIQKRIAELNYERVKKIITSRVKKAYYGGLLSAQKLKSIDANIILMNDFLTAVTDRYKSGNSSYLDIIRSKVEITRLRNEQLETQRESREVLRKLNTLMGIENSHFFILEDTLKYIPQQISGDSLMNYYSAGSIYLRLAEMEVENNKSILFSAEKSSLPDFNAGLSFQNRREDGRGYTQYWGLNIGVSLPMFYSTGVRGEVMEAEASLSIAAVRLNYAKLLVQQNTRSSYDNLSIAVEQLELFDSSLIGDTQAELNAGITAYRNGQVDLLNLLDVYRTYLQVQLEYYRMIYNALVSSVELEISSEVAE